MQMEALYSKNILSGLNRQVRLHGRREGNTH